MKKHEEGYALVLVLVVILVLGTIAGALMTFALSNLKSQTASIERMKEKYAAEGEIEKVVAQLENLLDENVDLGTICGVLLKDRENDITIDEDEKQIKVKLTSESGTAIVVCELLLTSENKIEKTGIGTEQKYTINTPVVSYASYDISYVQADTSGDGNTAPSSEPTLEGGGS